jgi:hypothetical protein
VVARGRLLCQLVGLGLGVILALGGCSGRSEDTNTTAPPSTSTPIPDLVAPAIPSAPRWPDRTSGGGFIGGQSLRAMIEWHRYAVVAQVMSEEGLSLYSETEPYTRYRLRVSDVISGTGLGVGEEILIAVPGGQKPNGAVEPQYGLPVKVGARYLIFIHDWPAYISRSPGYGGEAIARFEVSGDDLVIPNGFETYPGTAALSGVSAEEALAARSSEDPSTGLAKLANVTLGEAVEKIKATIAEGPIPEWPPEWSGLRDVYSKPKFSPAASPVTATEVPTSAAPTPVAPAASNTPTPAASPAP